MPEFVQVYKVMMLKYQSILKIIGVIKYIYYIYITISISVFVSVNFDYNFTSHIRDTDRNSNCIEYKFVNLYTEYIYIYYFFSYIHYSTHMGKAPPKTENV